MGNKLSAHQQQQIKAAFSHFDVDKNGQITLDEFQKVLRIRKSEVLRLLAECDMNDDGGISYDEFVRLVQKKFIPVYQTLLEGEGADGDLTLEKMQRVYQKAEVEVTDQEIEDYFNTMDLNKDNKLSFEEFIIGCFVNLAVKRHK
eukprot:Phypoly_transcript_16383.p1 GENE.Phypoly_transcript_16383~~Phypoly_transcript_16383.p1  ORF type:complete len:145 (-),score=19.42 Phypoly_transcript_16383:342-776(-)